VAEDWKLQVVSRQEIESWELAARRLRAVLDVISSRIEEWSGIGLLWRTDDLDTDGWRDIGRLTEYVIGRRITDDDGSIMKSFGAGGVVQGYLNTAHTIGPGTWAVNVLWDLRSKDIGLDCRIDFSAADGSIGSFDSYSPEWHASLMCAADATAHASKARANTIALGRALRKHPMNTEPRYYVGAVSFAPDGLASGTLPSSLTAFDCQPGASAAMVVVADPKVVVSDPASLVPDLLVLGAMIVPAS